jgi:MFS family permease
MRSPPVMLKAVLWPLGATLLAQIVTSWANLTVPVFAVRLAADLGVPAAWIGLYVSITYFAGMTSGVMGSPFIIRYGATRMLQICLLLCALSLALLTTELLAVAVLCAIIMGLGYGPTTPASSHVLSAQTPPRFMPLIFSIKQTGVPLGGVLAGIVVPALVIAHDWRTAAFLVAGCCVATALVLQPLRASLDAERQPRQRLWVSPLESIRLVWRHRGLRGLSLLAMTYSAVQMSLLSYLVTFLVEAIHRDLVTAGLVLAAAQLAGVGGRVLWGAVAGLLLPARHVLILLGLLMMVAGITMSLVTPAWHIVPLFAVAMIYGATAVGWNGVMLAELSRLSPPGQAVTATGGSLFLTFGGVMVGPVLFGAWVTATGGYSSGFVCLAALGLVGAALVTRRYGD